MYALLAILQNAQASLERLGDVLEEQDVMVEETDAFLDIRLWLSQAIALLEKAQAEGVLR